MDAMVTGRMSAEKKERGNRILEREGWNASRAINCLYDRIIEDGNVSMFNEEEANERKENIQKVKNILAACTVPLDISRFDNMTTAEIKLEKAKDKGWI